MKKNAPLAFRIPGELKKSLQRIADREARSMSQICELLLTIGVDAYEKQGARYLQIVLSGSKEA
jgi:predicted transcriptional regulator